MPASTSFEFRKGEDVKIRWTIRASSDANAAVVDITGWSFSFKVKRRDRDADPSLVIGTTTIVDAVNGRADTVLTSAELDVMEGDYRYALTRMNAGSRACYSQGYLTVVDTVES